MIQKIKNFIVVAIASSAMLLPGLMVPALNGVASAGIKGNLCLGTNVAADESAGKDTCGANKDGGDASVAIRTLGTKIVNAFSLLIGIISIIFIILGGFRYITSGGDSSRVGTAKNTIIYALVGLIIVALAQVIVHFVINSAQDASSTITTGP